MREQLAIPGTKFYLVAFLFAVACNAFARADKGKVCGTTDVRNFPDFVAFENCRVIEGNLSIVLIYDKEWENYQGRFSNLVEITGSLFLYRVTGLKSLGQLFPKLAVIGGQTLLSGYALVVYELFDLEDIGLSSLTVIRNGAVRIEKNRKLCYVDTIDWSRITKGVPASENYFQGNKDSIECANVCEGQCGQTGGIQRCWNSVSCQQMLSCPQECETGFCKGDVCCHPDCIGGCTGPSATQCLSCNAIVHPDTHGEDACMQHCPAGLYMYLGRRCLTADQCTNFGDYRSYSKECHDMDCLKLVSDENSNKDPVCSLGCPAGYQPDPNDKIRCLPCEDGKCPKVCGDMMIDNLLAAEDLKDCTIINGSLTFVLKNCLDEERLEDYLSDITEVTRSIDIQNSYGLHSLGALKNLRKLGGQKLIQNKYVLRVFNNQNLQELLPEESLGELEVTRGSVLFLHNGKLSYDKISEFISKTGIEQSASDDNDISMETNGDKISPQTQRLQLKLMKATAHIAFISWQGMQMADSRNLIGYSVHWKKVSSKSITVFPEPDTCADEGWGREDFDCFYKTCGDNVIHYIARLDPFSRYAAYVRALTVTSENAVSNVIYFRTDADVPSVPMNVQVKAPKPETLHVTWEPPAQPNSNITSYKIIWTHIPIKSEEYRTRDYCVNPLLGHEHETPAETARKTDCCACPKSSEDKSLSFLYTIQNIAYVKRPKDEERRRKRRSMLNDARATREDTPSHVVSVDNAEELTITDLGHFEVYNIAVKACTYSITDQTTLCSESAFVSGRTLPDGSSDVIHNVRVESVTNGLQIKWQDPPNPNGIVLTYEIEYMSTDMGEVKPVLLCIPYHVTNATENEFTISRLEPGAYKLRIRATSLGGSGPWTEYLYYSWEGQNTYECYRWTQEDLWVMGGYLTPMEEKARCEDDLGHVFTQGNNEKFPGCEECWCCKLKG